MKKTLYHQWMTQQPKLTIKTNVRYYVSSSIWLINYLLRSSFSGQRSTNQQHQKLVHLAGKVAPVEANIVNFLNSWHLCGQRMMLIRVNATKLKHWILCPYGHKIIWVLGYGTSTVISCPYGHKIWSKAMKNCLLLRRNQSDETCWTAYTPLGFFAEAIQIHCAAGQGPSAHRTQFHRHHTKIGGQLVANLGSVNWWFSFNDESCKNEKNVSGNEK